MAVRGITGAMMAGPMEQTKLVPFAYDQVRQRNLDLEAARGQGMETTLELQNAMDALGSIPGTEDDAEVLTKPFQDRLDKIHEQYGNDLGRAAPDIQRLAFDFMSNKSKESKELSKAGASRASLQASIDEMVTAGTLDPSTGAAYLQRATSEFNSSLDAYKKGEGDMYSGAVFNGTPVAKPDIKEDIFKIQPLIKADTFESFGYIPKIGKDADGNEIITGYVDGETMVKYSDAEVRERLTSNMLKSLGYGAYADQQVDLGLAGPRYDGSGLMGVESKINPLLQPLSSDPKVSEQQIKAAGATSEKEYHQIQGLEKSRVQSMHKKKIAAAVDKYDMTPEEAENALAESQWKGLLSDGVIDDIAKASRIGAFKEETIKVKDSTPQKTSIESKDLPYNTGSTYTTDDIQLGSRPNSNSAGIKERLESEGAVLEGKKSILARPSTSPEMKEVLKGEIAELENSMDNISTAYTPFKVAELLTRVDRGALTVKLEKVGLSLRGTEKVSQEQVEEAQEDTNKALISFYNLDHAYKSENNNIDIGSFNEDINFTLGLGEEDLQARLKDPEHVLPTGTKLADIAHMVKDVRTKFARFEDLESLEMTADFYVPSLKAEGKETEPERMNVNRRGAAIVAGYLRPTDPLNENVYIGDIVKNELSDNALKINQDFGGENNSALWAPQTYFAGYFDGKPTFLMDMAYYQESKGGDPKRIPLNLMNKYKYGGETFKATGGKRLVHLGDEGPRAVIDLIAQRTKDITHKLEAKKTGEAMEAALEVQRLSFNIDMMPKLQGTGIEAALSENFITGPEGDTEGAIGKVSRTLPPGFWNNILDHNNKDDEGNPTVIFDDSKNRMNVEKVTYPDGREEYSLYFLPSLAKESGDVANERDYLSFKGQKSWGNLSDLIFGLKKGKDLAQEQYDSLSGLLLDKANQK